MTETREVPHVSLRGVTKRYGSAAPVLENIDLTVSKGEFVSIIGPSGCGKSTILKLVSGLAPVTSGSLLVDGMTPVERSRDRLVHFSGPDAAALANGGEERRPWRSNSTTPRATPGGKESARCSNSSASATWRSPTRASFRAA